MGREGVRGIFLRSLSEELKDELASRDEPNSLEALISLAIKIDGRLKERDKERLLSRASRPGSVVPSAGQVPVARPVFSVNPTKSYLAVGPFLSTEEPMQLGRARLDTSERKRRLERRLCISCGQPGHF